MASIFTQIVQRKVPAHIVAETANYLAFLDIRPMAWGHTLVIPRQEVDYLFALEDKDLAGLMLFAKQVALGLQQVVPCLRVGMAVVGLEVPHAHIHLVPLHGPYDIDFKKNPIPCTLAELTHLAVQLQTAIKVI